MAAERSEGRPYHSRFAGGYLAGGQWLAEGMCDRQARKNKTQLPERFWKSPRWEREFLMQVRHANSLLKTYSVAAIVRALRTPEGKKVYSLSAPWLDPIIRDEQAKLDREAAAAAPPEAPPEPATEVVDGKPRPTFVRKKSTLSKLREIDGQA